MHVVAHAGGSMPEAKGNEQADAAAKAATQQPLSLNALTPAWEKPRALEGYEQVCKGEEEEWKCLYGAYSKDELQYTSDDRPILPKTLQWPLCQTVHGQGRYEATATAETILRV